MPTGKVKWYDFDKGFGFLSQDDGEDVYVRASALPDGIDGLKAGQRVEFGMAAGRRGPQALSVKVIDPPPSRCERGGGRARREHKHSPDELHGMVEDMITLLEGAVQPELRRGRTRTRRSRAGCPRSSARGGGTGADAERQSSPIRERALPMIIGGRSTLAADSQFQLSLTDHSACGRSCSSPFWSFTRVRSWTTRPRIRPRCGSTVGMVTASWVPGR